MPKFFLNLLRPADEPDGEPFLSITKGKPEKSDSCFTFIRSMPLVTPSSPCGFDYLGMLEWLLEMDQLLSGSGAMESFLCQFGTDVSAFLAEKK